jgi:tetratricopeptide (TPR) repeat protein
LAWAGKKDYGKAMKDLDEAVRLIPKSGFPYAKRAGVWSQMKQYDKALADYEKALQLDTHPHAARSLAWFHATCPDEKYRDGKRALALATKACDLWPNGWKRNYYLSALAAAHAELGDFSEAVKWQKAALADPIMDAFERTDLERGLKLFEAKKPVREE